MKKILCILFSLVCLSAFAQTDRHEVRSGNRKYRRGDYKQAEIDFRRALVKDSLSLAGNYNLAADLYRQERYDEALKYLDTVKDTAPESESAADWWYNKGAAQLQQKDYSGAKKSFRECLLLNPDDMDAKENYSYAKKKEEEQKQQQQQNQDQQNQDQNQDQQDQNQDQNKDQQDQNKDQQNKDQQNQDQNQDQDKQDRQQSQPQPQEISPQQAQQMLKAIQAKEKETQDKVNKEKAALLQSRQKDKNW